MISRHQTGHSSSRIGAVGKFTRTQICPM